MLYHSLKLYRLGPELQYTAGGYIWPVDRTIELLGDVADSKPIYPGSGSFTIASRPLARSVYADPDDEETANLRARVEDNGAVPLSEAEISILSEPVPIAGKERVYFVSKGELEKLVVNVLIVVYVP